MKRVCVLLAFGCFAISLGCGGKSVAPDRAPIDEPADATTANAPAPGTLAPPKKP
jgi:hypothetical protein